MSNHENFKDNKNSVTRKYHIESSKKLDNIIEKSSYLITWKERVLYRNGEVHVLLKFSESLEPTSQVYSHIAEELYKSDLSANIIKQKENFVIIKLEDSQLIIDKYKKDTY